MGRPRKTNYEKKIQGRTYKYGRVSLTLDGKKYEFLGRTIAEAEEKRDLFKEDYEFRMLHKDKVTFGDFADEWLRVFYSQSRDAERTKGVYTSAWERVVVGSALYDMPIAEITAVDLQEFFNSADCPMSTKKMVYNLMRKFYKYLIQEDVCKDLTAIISPPSVPENLDREIIVWEDEEIARINAALMTGKFAPRLTLLVYLAIYTGLRISELLAIKYTDIEHRPGEGYYLHVRRQVVPVKRNGKTVLITDRLKSKGSERTIPLPRKDFSARLREHKEWQMEDMKLNGYKNPDGFLFLTAGGRLYDRANLRRALNRVYKRIGVECKGFHTYRRTYGTLLCRAGVDITITSRIMGHASIETTARYYVYVSDRQKAQALKPAFADMRNVLFDLDLLT